MRKEKNNGKDLMFPILCVWTNGKRTLILIRIFNRGFIDLGKIITENAVG